MSTTMRQRLIALREARGLTRDEVAAQAKVPKTTLQTLEDKDQAASKWLVTLASFYGVNPLWLQTGKGPKDAGDAARHSPVEKKHQVIDQIQKNVAPESRIRRLDTVTMRKGYDTVAALFEGNHSVFQADVDLDLLAVGYELAQTNDARLLAWLDAVIQARIAERQGVQGGEQDEAAGRGVVRRGRK